MTTTITTNNSEMVAPRTILKFFTAVLQEEGVGAKVRRSIGTMKQRYFSPFLMLDHFNVDPSAGFPDHPHHGFSTVTYLLEGMFAHEDFTGAKGVLRPGDLQFMTAGKGIVHAEMPIQSKDGAPVTGMQLWVDLPEEMKECEPAYRDLKAAEIPIAKPNDKVTIKVIAGESYGVKSVQDLAHVAVDYYDYEIQAGGEFVQPFPENYNVFIYLLEGGLKINETQLNQYQVAFFNRDGDSVVGKVPETQEGSTRFVLIGGPILEQEVVQHGPFVTTSREKMYEVFSNYQYGNNGFENAKGWRSSIYRGIKDADVPKHEGKIEVVKDEL